MESSTQGQDALLIDCNAHAMPLGVDLNMVHIVRRVHPKLMSMHASCVHACVHTDLYRGSQTSCADAYAGLRANTRNSSNRMHQNEGSRRLQQDARDVRIRLFERLVPFVGMLHLPISTHEWRGRPHLRNLKIYSLTVMKMKLRENR